jgi:hypothetical protein
LIFNKAKFLNADEEKELADYFKELEEECMVEDDSLGQGEDRCAELVAIPEALDRMSGARRSKRQASDSDLEVTLKVEKLKVLKNEGNSDHKIPQVSFDNAVMIPNLENIGIYCGNF